MALSQCHIFLGGDEMKLHVLFDSKSSNVVAMAEEKDYVLRYILQNNFNEDYKISSIKKKSLVEKYLIVYEEFLLDEYEELVLTTLERRIVNNTMGEEQARIENTIDELMKMVAEYNFSSKDSAKLKEAIKVLEKNSKPKRLSILLNIKEFIFTLFSPSGKNIIDYFKQQFGIQEETKYFIHINIEED